MGRQDATQVRRRVSRCNRYTQAVGHLFLVRSLALSQRRLRIDLRGDGTNDDLRPAVAKRAVTS